MFVDLFVCKVTAKTEQQNIILTLEGWDKK